MRLLLDSHVALWWSADPRKLESAALDAIADPENETFVSAVSIWELGLKASKGKLRLPPDFYASLIRHGLEPLSFTAEHAAASIDLPTIHGDPFDRALVAQCLSESVTLMTRDVMLAEYGVAILRA